MKIRRLKAGLFMMVPLALFLVLREQSSWRPYVLPHDSTVYAAAFSADGRRITTAQENGTILEWETKSKQVLCVLKLPQYTKKSETWQIISPDGSLVAVCTSDCSVRIWEISTGKFIHVFVQSRTEKYTPGVVFSPDGKTIATTSWRTPVKLWDVASGKQKANFVKANISASQMAFSPDGRLFATTRSDNIVGLWNVASAKRLRILTAKRAVSDIAFSPDGSVLAAGSDSDGGAKPGEVMLWDTKTWQLKRILDGNGDFGPMIMLTFSPDSRILASDATGLSQLSLKLWDVATGKLVREIAADSWPLKLSPDGSMLAAGYGREHAVKLWRLK